MADDLMKWGNGHEAQLESVSDNPFRSASQSIQLLSLVRGEGLEPPTFRLSDDNHQLSAISDDLGVNGVTL